MLWSLVNPLLILAVYIFVFSVVFRAKWNLPDGDNQQFALLLFSGLIIFTIFAECANEAPGLILRDRMFVKQLVFPVEILPWVSLLVALFNFAVSFVVFSGFYLIVRGLPPISALYLPLLLFPLLLGTLGFSCLLASLGVFLRDVSQVVGVLTTALLFLSPIFYPASHIPKALLPYYNLNPFSPLLEMTRGVLFMKASPDWRTLGVLTVGSWIMAWCGFVWFMKTKKGFADVL